MFKAALLLVLLLVFGAGILRALAKLFLSAATFGFKLFCIVLGILAAVIFLLIQKVLPAAAKYLANAVPWIIAAFVSLGLLIYAAGRKFFHGESVSDFIKKLIPHEENSSRRTDFSLLLIELADSIQADISEKLKSQYRQVVNFLKNPLHVG